MSSTPTSATRWSATCNLPQLLLARRLRAAAQGAAARVARGRTDAGGERAHQGPAATSSDRRRGGKVTGPWLRSIRTRRSSSSARWPRCTPTWPASGQDLSFPDRPAGLPVRRLSRGPARRCCRRPRSSLSPASVIRSPPASCMPATPRSTSDRVPAPTRCWPAPWSAPPVVSMGST